jgi:predicted  nucleic acid-binding Zn-ribbon protein
MVFLLASFDEFTLFLKIVLWIAVPLIIVSFLVTTFLHYRQKKKNALRSAEDPEFLLNPEVDISLVSRLQKEVLHYKRRIKELQHALTFAKEVIPPETLNSRVASLHEEVEALNTSPELIEILPAGATGTSSSENGTLSENGALSGGLFSADTDSPASSAYLHDLVNEQKTHVLFLQQQLEARIRSFHDLEFQFRDNAALLEKMTISYEHIKHQLDDSDAAASMYRIEKDGMQAQINRLENSLRELQEQHTRSLKMLDQAALNVADKAHESTNGKAAPVRINETELAETGHS